MIPEQWYVVLESREVRSSPLGVLRMGERLVFWRDGSGAARCMVDRCAHRGASLALGACLPNGTLQCPFHGLEYDPSGRCVKIPANGAAMPVPDGFRLKAYPVHEEHGFLWIYWGEGEPKGKPRFFEDLGPELSYSTARDPWDNHYSRVVENQLDMAHLPFVHKTTIGRGNRTVVDGPGLLMREEGFFVYVYNRLDDGSPRRSREEVPVPRPDSDFKLEFIFPNLWENYIGEKVRILAAFVPVDAERSILYLRFYQGFMRLPGLRSLVHAIGNRANLVVAHQDRRVVNTQLPKGPSEGTGELLFPGDAPIMEYRKMRLAALKAVGKG